MRSNYCAFWCGGALIIISMVLLSCREEAKISVLKLDKRSEFSLPNGMTDNQFILSAMQWGDQLQYWSTLDLVDQVLTTYDLTQRTILSQFRVPRPVRPSSKSYGFYCHTLDSILVGYNSSERPGVWHDSTLLLVDRKGQILRSIDWRQAPVWQRANPTLHPDSAMRFGGLELVFRSGQIIVGLSPWNHLIGDSLFSSLTPHPLGVFDIRGRQDSFFLLPFKTPAIVGEYATSAYKIPAIRFLEGRRFVLSYEHTADVWIENQAGELEVVEMKSALFEPPTPIKLEPSLSLLEKQKELDSHHDIAKGLLGGVSHDPFRKTYLRMVVYPMDSLDHASRSSTQRSGKLIYDENFSKIGECLTPEGYSPIELHFPEGIGLYHHTKSKGRRDSLFFDVFEPRVVEESLSDFRREAISVGSRIRPGGWAAYLNETFDLGKGEYAVLFVPAYMACEGCLDYMVEYFLKQSNAVASRPLYCVVAAPNAQMVKGKLRTHGIGLDSGYPRLLLDLNGAFMSYVDREFSNGVVLLLSGGQMVAELIVDPAAISQVGPTIDRFFEEKEGGEK